MIPYLSRHIIDNPNSRSSHRKPTPLGGGVSFVALACVSSLVLLISGQRSPIDLLPLMVTPIPVVDLLDDRYNIPSALRYFVQFVTALFLVGNSPLVQGLRASNFVVGWLFVLLALQLIIIVTALVNFANFMDGLDGLLAGCMSVVLLTCSTQLSAPLSQLALVGAVCGFLIWNWSPAKIFMGDVGSTFLGAVFAGLLLQASSWHESLGLLLVSTPLLADACICVFRRLLVGQRVFQAHRLHLYQRLHQAGWSHSRVSLTYIVSTAALSIAFLSGGLLSVIFLSVVVLLVGVLLDMFFALPFSIASQC